MSASNYSENKLVDHVLGTTAYPKPAAVYVALFTADPGEDGSGPEVTGLGYARQAAAFTAAANGTARNAAQINYPAVNGGPWGTITHFGIYDAAAGGNLLVSGALTTPRQITDNGDILYINASEISVTLD